MGADTVEDMFETRERDAVPAVSLVAGWRAVLAGLGAGLGDAERIDLLRGLEELKAAAAAAQARISVDLDASTRRSRAAAGIRSTEQGRGVAAGQIALARRDSPHNTRGACHHVCVSA